ncbi:hypothetical protein VZT92_011504 [Zoarces viviparus]|uniref:Uncharacterized protein n=1 Tax=Zoarces viviparus TaxID=48416 RepID=A0AAW1F8W9_ZOAVI
MGALLKSQTLCLQQLVDTVGPTLSNAPALGSLLGLHSVRVARRLLELWSQRLTGKERSLLMNHSQGKVEPDPADLFPEISLSPGNSPAPCSLQHAQKNIIQGGQENLVF